MSMSNNAKNDWLTGAIGAWQKLHCDYYNFVSVFTNPLFITALAGNSYKNVKNMYVVVLR
jgi:hypothetical protein